MGNEANADEQDLSSHKDKEHEHMISFPPGQSYPWLLISESVNDKPQIFYSITEDRYDTYLIPELQNKEITCCYKGWLVLCDYDIDDCLLLNPSTLVKVQLPPMKIVTLNPCVLSSSVMDNNCLVVLISRFISRLTSCHLGDSESVEQYVYVEGRSSVACAPINFDGRLYALSFDYNLISADFSDPHLDFTTVIRGKPFLPYIPCGTKAYLVESSGELLFIYIYSRDYDVVDIKIFRANFINKKWENLKCLGDRTIFIDECKALSSPASIFGLRGNCIYFVRRGDKYLYAYDLEDDRISLSLPCPIVNSSEHLNLFWVSVV